MSIFPTRLILILLPAFLGLGLYPVLAQNTIQINAENRMHATSRMLLGGDEVLASSYALEASGQLLKSLPGHSWRIHLDDDSYGWRWDTNEIVPGGRVAHWGSGITSGSASVSAGNQFIIDSWDRRFTTDLNRYGTFIKTSGNPTVSRMFYNNNSGVSPPIYIRFDLGIAGDVPFNAPDNWTLLQITNTVYQPILSVTLTQSRQILLSAGGLSITLPNSLNTDQMVSVEIGILPDRAEIYINHSLQGTIQNSFSLITTLQIGCVGPATAEGKIYLDAVRADTAPIGQNVELPWQHTYLSYITFDHGRRTVDDIARLMEKIGGKAIWAIPIPQFPDTIEPATPPNGHGYVWQTPQYYADFVEYLNGTPDADYLDLANNLDFSHQTPSDNWANLRAARGRVNPYEEKYFEIGNEPYYRGGWRGNIPGYGQAFNEHAVAMKAVDPSIKLGLGVFWQFPTWEDVLLPIVKSYVDWISMYHYYSKPLGQSLDSTRDIWLGAPVARDSKWVYSSARKNGFTDYFYNPDLAHAKINQYLSDRSDVDDIFVGVTELGYQLTYQRGQGNWLGDAINRAGWIGIAAQKNVEFAHTWTLLAQDGFTNSVIGIRRGGSVEVTPSYSAFQLWGMLLGDTLVDTQVQSSSYPISLDGGFTVDYLSAWATVSENQDFLRLLVINRDENNVLAADIQVNGFQPVAQGKMWKLGGNGYDIYASNAQNPNHVTIQGPQNVSVSNTFSYPFEPLSITVLEFHSQEGSQPDPASDTTPPGPPQGIRIIE